MSIILHSSLRERTHSDCVYHPVTNPMHWRDGAGTWDASSLYLPGDIKVAGLRKVAYRLYVAGLCGLGCDQGGYFHSLEDARAYCEQEVVRILCMVVTEPARVLNPAIT